MSFQVRKAERKKAKLKLGISGPSGSGKTFSALHLAHGIAGDWSKVTLIDTENGSGELYAHLGEYNVIPFEPPYSPQRYIEAIQAAVKGGAEVIVIDSISHEWDGKGGCLDIQTRMGGQYQHWAKVTPMHNSFVEAILQSPAHVIVTTRKKQDYEMSKGADGKNKVQKVGLKEIQRDGFEYELTINFDVEINHFATTSKDRTGLFMPRGPFQITTETGRELLAWANSGATPVESPKPRPSTLLESTAPQTKVSSDQRLKESVGVTTEIENVKQEIRLLCTELKWSKKDLEESSKFHLGKELHTLSLEDLKSLLYHMQDVALGESPEQEPYADNTHLPQ